MSIDKKIKNAKSTTWVADGLTEKEVKKVVGRAIKRLKKI